MGSDNITTILIMAVLVLLSAYFSATETAFSSVNKTRLKALTDKGNRKAERALTLAEQYDRLLSTILIGNNIVNIAVASIGTVLFVKLYGDIGATISTVVITVVVLIFGEISPKILAKDAPEKFAMFSAPIIRVLIWILTPINFLFTLWKKLLAKFFKTDTNRKMTQDELLVLVDEVEQNGSIDKEEGNLLRSAIEFTDRDAEDILTHRVDLEAVPIDATKEEIAKVFAESRYSRILVYRDTIDHIVGVIHQKDLYDGSGIIQGNISSIMTVPLFVTRSIKISNLLKLLQKSKSHIAVVSDEYGGTLGIVTMEDILEELVGEIWDEHDEIVEDFKKLNETTYQVSGTVDMDKLARFFHINGDFDCTTVSGWAMEQLGRIPNEGDSFVYGDLHVTVTATDYRRVLEVQIHRQSPEEISQTGKDHADNNGTQ